MKLLFAKLRLGLASLGLHWLNDGIPPLQVEVPAVQLQTETLEERWNPSIGEVASWMLAPNADAAGQVVSLRAAAPEIQVGSEPALGARALQALLDGPDPIVDLGGQTWIVPTRLTITPQNSGKTIQNGTIKFTFEGTVPRVAGLELVQGRRWWNAKGDLVSYPSGYIGLTLKNLILDGDFPYDYGLQAYNEAKADELNKGYNLVSTVTNAASSIYLDNVRFQNSGNSAIAGSFMRFYGRDISADRVAKHVIGLRGVGGVKVSIDRLTVSNSGSVVDFHNDGTFFDVAHPDVAVVNNIFAQNIRGRSKVAGNNWSIDGRNWWFEQDSVVNLNLWPAFDLAKNPRRFVLDGFVAINFPATGLATLADRRTGGEIQLSNIYVCNSVAGMKVQQDLSIVDSAFDGVVSQYRSSLPEVQSNVVKSTQSYADWATVFDQIERLYKTKNAEWGTDYDPRYWAPKPVQLLMEELGE